MTATAADARTEHRQPLPPIPEPGRVVEVRGSTWAVEDVRQQQLPRSPADEGDPRMQHVVALQSLAEDRLGETLTVVWELEVGHTVVPDQGLPETIGPDAFDDPNILGAVVDAVRWGAVTSADATSFQAPFRSGANVEPYQLEPLRRALATPRTNLLLADGVGLGKTIEAGLVIQELLLRHRARTVVIVCPPSLSLKWQDEMREKFGLDFVIVNSELMAEVRRTHGLAANPFRIYPRVIVSMAWLPTPRAQRLLRDVLAGAGQKNSARQFAFDVLVVDEAHHIAPASPSTLGGGRGYALDSKRTIATRKLAEKCEHRLFLSATPHNGHSESFTALLEMIDNRRFSRGASIDEAALKDITIRRLKTDIPDKNFRPARSPPSPSPRRTTQSRPSPPSTTSSPRARKPTAASDPATSSRSCSRSASSPAHGPSPAPWSSTTQREAAAYRRTRTTTTTPKSSAAAPPRKRKAPSTTPSSRRFGSRRRPIRSARRARRRSSGSSPGVARTNTSPTRA
ncbi:MAG: SNF2-related protein [Tetrasphaera sp.]